MIFWIGVALFFIAIIALATSSAEEEYKTFWRRLFAIYLDSIALGLLIWPIMFISVVVKDFSEGLASLLIVVTSALGVIYPVYFVYRFGQTPGKMATGVMVLSNDGYPLRFKQAVLREIAPILYVVFSIITISWALITGDLIIAAGIMVAMMLVQSIWSFLEIVTMLTNKRKRALHDFIAGSVVVKEWPEDRIPSHGKILWGLILLFIIQGAAWYIIETKHPEWLPKEESKFEYIEYKYVTTNEEGKTNIVNGRSYRPKGYRYIAKEDEVAVETVISETTMKQEGKPIKIKTIGVNYYKKGKEPREKPVSVQ